MAHEWISLRQSKQLDGKKRKKKKKPFRIKQTFLKLNNAQADSESLP